MKIKYGFLYLSILAILAVLLVACKPQTQPDASVSEGMPVPGEDVDEAVVEEEQETEETPAAEVQKTVTITKLPPPPPEVNFCTAEDSYEGISPIGIVGADIVGMVEYKGEQYCKANSKWEKNATSYDFTFYFQGANKQVWLEKVIDGKKEIIHTMENGQSLI